MEAMGKLIKLRVFIQGMRGIGLETCKNLALAGPKEIVIHDLSLVQASDLGNTFYSTEADINKRTRAQTALQNLQSLNPYVKIVNHTEAELTNEFLSGFSCVVFTECYDREFLVKTNNFLRSKNIGFIWSGAMGFFGFAFVDF
jgi:ubiquitin-activating enzyme E1